MSVQSVYAWLNDAPRQRRGMAAFQRFIGAALLLRVSTEFPFADYLFGPRSFTTGLLGEPQNRIFQTVEGTYAVLAALAVSAALLVLQRFVVPATVGAYLAFQLLTQRTPELGDGGDNLAQLALLYMLALVPAYGTFRAGSLRVWLHNLAAVSVCVQVCIVYFFAGISKAHGDTWQNGTALYLISQVEWFAFPQTREWFSNSLIATAGAYSTVAFQVWFPVAMFSRLKVMFLLVALFFHIGIAVSMGLVSFSLIMAGGDFSLITDAEYEQWRDRFRRTMTKWRPSRPTACVATCPEGGH